MSRSIGPLVLACALALPLSAIAQESSPAARAALAHQLYDGSLAGMDAGRSTPAEVYTWSVRWMRAELEAHTATAAQAHYDRMTQLLTRVRASVASGMLASSAGTECQYYVAEARAWLAHPPTVP